MAQPGEVAAPAMPSRVPTIQKWLTRFPFICLGIAFGVLLIGARWAPYLGFAIEWLLFGIAVGVGSIGQGIICYLYPERTTGKWRREIERVGWTRLLGLAYIWLGIWGAGTYLSVAVSLAATHQLADNIFIIGSLIALFPWAFLKIVAWVRRHRSRGHVRAAPEQASDAWMMMGHADTGRTGHEHSRWRDRWRNRMRRAQRRTRG